MAYIGTKLTNSITIEKIYSIHYFEYMSNFSFEGEVHNFWEFVCVDKGEVVITAGKKNMTLKKGDVVGNIIIKNGNNVVGKVDAVVNENIKTIGFFKLLLNNFKDIVSGNLI